MIWHQMTRQVVTCPIVLIRLFGSPFTLAFLQQELLTAQCLQWAKRASLEESGIKASDICKEVTRLIEAAQGKVDYVKASSSASTSEHSIQVAEIYAWSKAF